jgi:hypothetical protein
MTTFRLPFKGLNLAGMDSQVLRPIITELYEVEVEVEEEDGFEEEEDPVVAKHHRTESKKQDKSDVVFIFHEAKVSFHISSPIPKQTNCRRKNRGRTSSEILHLPRQLPR